MTPATCHPDRKRHTKEGLCVSCYHKQRRSDPKVKDAERAYLHAWRVAHPHKVSAQADRARDARHADPAKMERAREYSRQWIADPANLKRRREYASDPAVREAKVERQRIRRAQQPKAPKPEPVRATCHPGRRHAARGLCKPCYIRVWFAENRAERNEKISAAGHKRRARLLDASSPGVTPAEWCAILVEHGHACVYCGAKGRLTREHLIPIARGGRDEPANVAPACRRCNVQKNKKTPEEYFMYLEKRITSDASFTWGAP